MSLQSELLLSCPSSSCNSPSLITWRVDNLRVRFHFLATCRTRAEGEIVAAIDVLVTNPLIGRPASNGKRELVIGKGSHGYVALYRYVEGLDMVFVLAVRAQREAGFTR